MAIRSDTPCATGGQVVRKWKQAITQVAFGGWAQPRHGARSGETANFASVQVSSVNKAPAPIHVGVVQ